MNTAQKSNTKNTGSPEYQIALFSERIKHLTEHLKSNKKDFSAKRGLIGLVGKRNKMRKYFNRKAS